MGLAGAHFTYLDMAGMAGGRILKMGTWYVLLLACDKVKRMN